MGGTEVIDLKNMLVRIYLIRHGETERLVSGQHARQAAASLLTTLISLDPLYCYGDDDERDILKYIQLSKEG